MCNVWRGADSRCEGRQGSLSLDWLLDTAETLELRTKPKEPGRAAGGPAKPGGRRPDWPGLSRRLLGLGSGPDLLCSPGGSGEEEEYHNMSGCRMPKLGSAVTVCGPICAD